MLVLAVACFAVAQREQLGPNAVGLAFSNTIQMLVFYTWTVRLIAESIGHFSATEKLAYLANHVPQEGVQHLRMTHTGCCCWWWWWWVLFCALPVMMRGYAV